MMPFLLSDGYKQSHKKQYPEGTTLIYSNFTPRSGKYAIGKTNGVVVFGIQAFIQEYLIKYFQENFFNKSFDLVKDEYIRVIQPYFGGILPETEHLEYLHNLGYLPLHIKALPEGSICPFKVPVLTIYNTDPKCFWLTNFIETLLSMELWKPMTSATIAYEYKKLLTGWADKTCDNNEHLPFQGHDFSMRGAAGLGAAQSSGAGHLLSFSGTDTIPAVVYVNKYYPNKDDDDNLIGCSVPATEHSVSSIGTKEGELDTFRRLITEVYPNGIISIVSDTWDLWKVLTEYLPMLKDEIMERDGKTVVRPDSGNPVVIICGTRIKNLDEINPYGVTYSESECKGVIELLWDTFGGTINSKGYKVLDSHIGAIYGDSITLEIADEICRILEFKGFASSNIVFGIGSYTYQYNTRDTYGFAMKATYGEVNGKGRAIFKDPVTDDGMKKSAKGLLQVTLEDGVYQLKDDVDWHQESAGELRTVFINGALFKNHTFTDIRNRLASQ